MGEKAKQVYPAKKRGYLCKMKEYLDKKLYSTNIPLYKKNNHPTYNDYFSLQKIFCTFLSFDTYSSCNLNFNK